MKKKIISWSLCLAMGIMTIVSCRQDVEVLEGDPVQSEQSSLRTLEYSEYVGDPRVHGCRIVTADQGTDPRGAAGTSVLWSPGQTVTVSFIGGSDFVRQKVTEYAKQWEQYANLTFEFVPNNGMLRVSFIAGAGSYSYIGSSALTINQNLETMNFGWFDDNTDDEEFSRTVLHEFGHALGLIHEHQHPEVTLDWDQEFAYAYYAGSPNFWSRDQVNNNILYRYDPSILTYNDYDINSIMHYSIIGQLINSPTDTPLNTVLSDGDKEIAGLLYPF